MNHISKIAYHTHNLCSLRIMISGNRNKKLTEPLITITE